MGDTFPGDMGDFKFASSSDEALPFLADQTAFCTGSGIRYSSISTKLKQFTP
jgi:hypothetical protein